MRVTGIERKIRFTKDIAIDTLARAEAVMVTNQHNERHVQAKQQVTLQFKLVGHAKVGHVTRVEYEVNVSSGIDVGESDFHLIIPALRVGDDGETNVILSATTFLNAGNVPGIEPMRSLNAPIIGMIIYHVARGKKKECRKENEEMLFSFHVAKV